MCYTEKSALYKYVFLIRCFYIKCSSIHKFTGDCSTNLCGCARNKINCIDFCNCENIVCMNTDAHPQELINEDLEIKLKFLSEELRHIF